MQIPWDTGISQATEAVTLPVKERLAKFSFTYKGSQPQFNSRMLQKLQCEQEQKQQNPKEFPDTASLTPPDSTQSSPITVQSQSSHITPLLSTNSSTSARKKTLATKAPKAPASRQCSHKEENALFKRRKKVVPVVVLPHIDSVVQVSEVMSLSGFSPFSFFNFLFPAINCTFVSGHVCCCSET